MRKATQGKNGFAEHGWISIPAFREEGDTHFHRMASVGTVFQSPPSVRKATQTILKRMWRRIFQSPPSVRKATDGVTSTALHIPFQSPPSVRKATTNPIRNRFTQGISIPAFREEGDGGEQDIPIVVRISIPAFREEGDSSVSINAPVLMDFNPRLP